MTSTIQAPVSDSLNVLIFAIGTAGDVYPNIAIGKELRLRGHRVALAGNSYFEQAVRRAGLDFISMGDVEEYLRVTADPELWQRGKGFKIMFREMMNYMRPVYDTIVEHAAASGTVVIASGAALGARLAHEKLHIPLVTLYLQPLLLRTLERPPTDRAPSFLTPMLRRIRGSLFGALDKWVLNPLVLPGLNAFRAELNLPPLDKIFDGWIHSPQLIIGLFPEWFAARQPDWPAQLRQTGFPLYDDATESGLAPEVEEFLQSGSAPLVFAPGSGMQFAKSFFEASVEACRSLGRRGILLTRFKDQIPAGLPDGVKHFPFVPHSLLLTRAAALIHHGGIGTMAAACKAGIPQLVCPFSFDQPDNARRLRKLGAGDRINPKAYRPALVTRKLRRLLTSSTVAQRCKAIAADFDTHNPIRDTCVLIETSGARTQVLDPTR